MGAGDDNALDFVPRLTFLPIEWRSLGAAFALKDRQGPAASGGCRFVVREGVDAAEASTTGRVVEGGADLGVAVKLDTLALGVSVGGVAFRTGLDDPTAALARRAGAGVPSLKLTAAKRFDGDNYAAFSYDLKQRRPELSACWTGDARTERATLLFTADPIMRAVKVSAAVSTPGPEWRKVLYNDETDLLEYPQDDGGRHTLFVQHEARWADPLYRTRIGCRLDLGRLANFAADYVDYRLEEKIPAFIWRLPLVANLYGLLVPAEDDDQVRYHWKHWELEVSQDFSRGPRPLLALSKASKYGTVSASYDLQDKEAGVSYSRAGLTLGARVGRIEGSGWAKPAIHLAVEPLSLLG